MQKKYKPRILEYKNRLLEARRAFKTEPDAGIINDTYNFDELK